MTEADPPGSTPAWPPIERPTTEAPASGPPAVDRPPVDGLHAGDVATPPGMVEIVSAGLDLNLRLSREVRQLSLYVGLLFLAAIGPVAAIAVARSIRDGGFNWLIDILNAAFDGTPIDLSTPLTIAFLLGAACFVAISVDVQLLATGLLGAGVGHRHLEIREAIALARRGFWRLIVASIAVGLILIIPRQVLGAAIRDSTEAGALLGAAFDVLLSMPFAYVGAAVVLGRAGPIEAVRQSWGMAGRRWRLALVIGIVNTAVSYLSGFAIGAGLDILIRIATALGIDQGLGPLQSLELIAIVGFAIVALGSLTLTIATLSVAPQVVAWVRLGGSLAGIPRDDPGGLGPGPGRASLVSLPMTAAIVVATIAAAAEIVGPR
jgi:hypothetical protein